MAGLLVVNEIIDLAKRSKRDCLICKVDFMQAYVNMKLGDRNDVPFWKASWLMRGLLEVTFLDLNKEIGTGFGFVSIMEAWSSAGWRWEIRTGFEVLGRE